MEFSFTVLGSSAAIPAFGRNLAAHVVQHNNSVFLIDCGDGTQIQLDKHKIKKHKINQIFISHLHGDHIFGLFGLLSSYSLLGRTNKLQIFSPKGLKPMLDVVFEYSKSYLSYPLQIIDIQCDNKYMIFDNDHLEVFSFPLKHRVECYGYLFKEKKKPFNIQPNAIGEYQLNIQDIKSIKQGNDFITKEGKFIRNTELVLQKSPEKSFAYCCDTAYYEPIIDMIRNCDLIYHDATFDQSYQEHAALTFHSTASDAARIAFKANVKKLILGHFSTRYIALDSLLQQAKSIFEESFLAVEGEKIKI